MIARAVLALACAALALAGADASPRSSRPAPADRAAVLDVGDARARATVERALREAGLLVLDDGLVDAAARGAGYAGSTNLAREDARRLARAIGASLLVLGTASVVERSSDNGSRSGDAFFALFFVDGVTGSLLRYRSCRAEAADLATATAKALGEVHREASELATANMEAARSDVAWDPEALDLRDGGESADVIPPRFFARPSPKFSDDADRAHAVASVDLVVQFNADGTYGPIEVTRWAGFGLDEAAVEAVRSSHFWPARKSGRVISARALLRYNFRFRDH